jgi:hypothetical protein
MRDGLRSSYRWAGDRRRTRGRSPHVLMVGAAESAPRDVFVLLTGEEIA